MIEKLMNIQRNNIHLTQVLAVLINRHYKNQIVSISEDELKLLPEERICIAPDYLKKKLYAKICRNENEANKFIEEYKKEESCDCEKSHEDVANLVVKALKDFEKSLKALSDR